MPHPPPGQRPHSVLEMAGHGLSPGFNSQQPLTVPDHVLLRLIGRGSYGEVWLARNVMGTLRAVKVVYRDAFEQDRPFDRELAGLQQYEPLSRSHEGLVHVLQVGHARTAGCFYYVMELADHAAAQCGAQLASAANATFQSGYQPKTLARELRRRGRLPLEECVEIAISLASALGHLHKHGLVHRDLKPSNIIFIQGRPKIADIGLVTTSGDSRSLVGTEGFFPPQGPGLPQADLYALGKVLYEASTGLDRLRFPQMPAEWLNDPSHARLMEFNEVVLKACETDPAKRYPNAEEMLADLALLQVGKSVRQWRRLERRLRYARRLGVLALVLACAAFIAYGLAERQTRFERETRLRLERAETEARQQLAEARLAQARALRRTGEAGHRFETLDLIAAAAQAQPSLQLRHEAVNALGLLDVRLVKRLPTTGISHAEPAVDRQAQRYVCTDARGEIALRRVSDDAEICRLPSHGARPDWLPGFSPDGRFLAVRPTFDSLDVWDLEQQQKVFELPPQREEVVAQFVPNSRGLIWSARQQPLRFCELPSGIIRAKWPVFHPVWRFCSSPEARYLALAYFGLELVEVLDTDTGQIISRMPQPAFVQGLQWHPSKPLLATGGHDRIVRLWNPLSGEELQILRGHQSVAPALDFHPTADVLASSSWDGTTRLWDIDTGGELVVLPEAGDNLQFTTDGRWLTLNEYSDAHALICEVATEVVCRTLKTAAGDAHPTFTGIMFDPAGGVLAGVADSGAHLVPLQGGLSPQSLWIGVVYSALFDPDGRYLVTSGQAGVLQWTLQREGASQLNPGRPTILSGSGPTGRICRSGDKLAWTHEDQIHLRVAGAGQSVRGLAVLDDVALSRDGLWLAASDLRGSQVQLWRGPDWAEVLTIPTSGRVRLAFSPEQRYLVIGGANDYLFWDLEKNQVTQRLSRLHTSGGFGVLAFSPDGTLLAVGRTRSRVALHAYPSLEELALFDSPRLGGVSALAFDMNGQQLAAASGLGQVQIWDLPKLRRHLKALGLDWQPKPY
jgi:WD40 repeat protein